MSKKIISICLMFILSLTLMVPVCFAADNPWVNEIIGLDGQTLSNAYLVQWSGAEFYWGDPVPEDYARSGGYPLFNQTLPYHEHKTTDFLRINQPSIFLSIEGYDIYYVTVVRSMSGLSPDYQSEFSFYPLTAKLYTVDGDHNGYDAVNVSKVTHTDSQFINADRLNMGFSAVWKLPDNLENNAVSYVEFTSPSGSMINGNSVFNNYILYAPAGDSAAQSANVQRIVDAIQSQTDELSNLIQGNGGDPAAGAINSELSSAIEDVDRVEQDIHMQAEEAFKASDSLIQSFDPAAFQSAGNLYKQLSQSAFDSLGLISVFILIPLILFCVGAFIGKLK